MIDWFGWFMVGLLVMLWRMVVVVIHLAVTIISIMPLQLGLESVVLLGEVFLPVVLVISLPVSPLEMLVFGDVDVLEVMGIVVTAVLGLGRNLGKGCAEADGQRHQKCIHELSLHFY